MARSNAEICEIKTISEKEILKVSTSVKKAIKSVTRSIKAYEALRAERVTASQKVASAVSEGKLKRKATESEAAQLSETLRQETVRAAKATNMANVAVMRKDEAERGIKHTTERRLEAQYRSTIESLEVELKTLKE